MLVVGAPNSSNSNRLREIAAEQGVPSYLIDDADALDPELARGRVDRSASPPAPRRRTSWSQELIDRLRELGEVELSALPGVTENVRFRMPPQLADAAG